MTIDQWLAEGEAVAACEEAGAECEGWGRLVDDPFDSDVNGRSTPMFLCDACYGRRCDEI